MQALNAPSVPRFQVNMIVGADSRDDLQLQSNKASEDCKILLRSAGRITDLSISDIILAKRVSRNQLL